ncbi:oligosaccharide flippase family protein [Sorangium sp. So ce136]|uniref:oligosaccharide flippase family protein n=1 Tax=Sorangium sp. So ce136 TaxID=3133284 RepID=UPI003F085B71
MTTSPASREDSPPPARRSVSGNIALKTVSDLVSRGVRMVLAVVAARLLGPAGFGDYSYAFAVGFLLGELADLGLHMFIAREVARDPGAAIGPLVRLKLAVTLAAGAVGLLVGLLTGAASPRRTLVWLLTAAWLMASFVEMLNQVFRGHQRMEREVLVAVTMAVASFGLGTAALLSGLGALGLAWGLVAGHLLALALAVALAAQLLDRRQWSSEGATLPRSFLSEAGPLAVAMIASPLYFQIDLLMLGWMSTPRAVGDMSAVQRVIGGAMMLPGVVRAAVFPAFVASRSASARRRLAALTFVGLMTAGALMSAGVWWLGGPIVRLVFGPQYASAVLPLQLLTTALVWMMPEFAIGPLLFATGQQRSHAVLWVTSVLLIAAGNVWAVPAHGAAGAAMVKLVVTLGLVAGEVIVLWRVRDHLGVQ